jgi:ribosomal-protein-alanine N-acetyltransferase
MSRIALRPPGPEDSAEFLHLVRVSRTLHRGAVSPASDASQFRAYVARARTDAFAALLVCRRQDAVILGAFNLSQIFYGPFRNAYLGYWVGAPFARRGYMREAMPLVLRYAFQVLKLHRLEANIQPTNARSIALARNSGFRREGFSPRYLKVSGRWRDHERWAITIEDWRRLRSPRSIVAAHATGSPSRRGLRTAR